jgi:hypothetical protein
MMGYTFKGWGDLNQTMGYTFKGRLRARRRGPYRAACGRSPIESAPARGR